MAKRRSKKQQKFTLQPWMYAAIAAVLIGVVAGIVLISQSGDEDNTYTNVSVQEAYERTQSDPDAVFVDIRRPDEWELYGYPTGAILLQQFDIEAVTSGSVEGLPKDQPVYVICNSGNRSVLVAEHLIDLGYDQVYNVEGGIQAWIDAGLPRTAYSPQ